MSNDEDCDDDDTNDKQDERDANCVHACLRDAAKYGLEEEVVLFALRAMKVRPSQTIASAMQDGFDEWIK